MAGLRASALLIVACTACVESDSSVTYKLARAGQDTLPFVLRADSSCIHTLEGGAVEFPGDKSYRSSFDIVVRCSNGTKPPTPDIGTEGAVKSSGDTIIFLDAAGKETGRGLLTPDSLVVQGPLHRLTYLREQ
jgi:hypothetical protein